jgi:hypothetical protein
LPPKIPEQLQLEVRLRADFLCEYCHTDETFQLVRFTIDHVVPIAHGGSTESENLALACFHCNRQKSDRRSFVDPASGLDTPFFDPRSMVWSEHFAWSADGTRLIGKTDIGRVTIKHLGMNRERLVLIRSADLVAKRHPPKGDPRE